MLYSLLPFMPELLTEVVLPTQRSPGGLVVMVMRHLLNKRNVKNRPVCVFLEKNQQTCGFEEANDLFSSNTSL